MKVTYRGENGQGKIGTCITNNCCSDTAGCQLVTTRCISEECKVLYIK